MTSLTAFENASPAIASSENRWQAIAAWLVKRRVRLTVFVFVALMAEDVLIGVRPHDLFDGRDIESVVGIALIAVGLAIRSWAAGILQKSREVTTSGPYAIIRNPLYVGSFLVMGGFCSLIDDFENIFFVMGPVAGLYFLQVLHEERFLSRQFGPRWEEYARAVPRFVPRRLPTAPFVDWSMDSWTRNREYRAFGAVLLGMAAVQLWHWM